MGNKSRLGSLPHQTRMKSPGRQKKSANPQPLALNVSLWHNTYAMKRWIGFMLAIAVGVGLGLFYGWVIRPVEYVDTSPNTLRIDYKSDYVLMVAEAYQAEGNLDKAIQRLTFLGEASLVDLVYKTMVFAETIGYTDTDLAKMQNLLSDLKAYSLLQETPAP